MSDMEHEQVQALRALLRAGLDLFVARRSLTEEERAWSERVQEALADTDAPPLVPAWRYVGCLCGATVRQFADGARLNADGTPHTCRALTVHKQRIAQQEEDIARAVEDLLVRAYHEARTNCRGKFPWQEG